LLRPLPVSKYLPIFAHLDSLFFNEIWCIKWCFEHKKNPSNHLICRDLTSFVIDLSSGNGNYFEHIMAILELIEPIINSKTQMVSNVGNHQIKDGSMPLKTKKNFRKGKGL
jgi:hypothetical protein